MNPSPPLPARLLAYINLFRGVTLAVLLVLSLLRGADGSLIAGADSFYLWAVAYGVLIGLSAALRRGPFGADTQLTLGVAVDISMLSMLMHLNGGILTGWGMLLLPFLAVASLLASGRYALFYASLACFALFSTAAAEALNEGDWSLRLLRASFLSSAGFITCTVTWLLARRARVSEALAARRGDEIARLGRLNALALQELQAGVLVLDEVGRISQYNRQALQFFPRLEHGALVPELDAQRRAWANYPGSQPQPLEVSVRGRRLIGRMVPLTGEQDRGHMVFLRDLADFAEESRRFKLAALGRLTANLAHEIRNPLSAISHAAELLTDSDDDPIARRLAGIVRDNARRIDHLVEEVTQLGRRDRIEPETVLLSQFIGEFLEQFALSKPEAAGRVLCEFAASGCRIRFDRGHLQRILWNLVGNGWRHSRQLPGSVKIRVDVHQPGEVQLEVLDDGPGIPDSVQVTLFEPFMTTEASGTGLGLYIARELAEANDAHLEYLPPGGCFRLTAVRVDE